MQKEQTQWFCAKMPRPIASMATTRAHTERSMFWTHLPARADSALGLNSPDARWSVGLKLILGRCETFAHNHKEALVIKRDIQLISDDELLDLFASRHPDILLGGPPCQGFSVCRKNAGDPTDPKNSLFVEFLRVARVLQPDYVVMENVPNIEKARTQRGESVIGIVERELKELGYHVNHIDS